MNRFFDLVGSLALLIIFSPVMMLIALLVLTTSRGPIFYWSNRIGKDNVVFQMPKFRTMLVGTPVVATHLLEEAKLYLTPIGGFLRESSLDELPQLWTILCGKMSFIGPRPALCNQHDLIELRTVLGVYRLKPGLTGWAQVNGRDELSIKVKVQYEVEYLQRRSFYFNVMILGLTFLKVIRRAGISH